MSQTKEFQEQIQKTSMEKYGCQFPSQSDFVKEKIKNTCLERYGVEHVMLNIDILEKCSKNAYRLKEYKLPSGNIIKIQGYEHFGLDELLLRVNESDIIHGCRNVPEIWYNDAENKRHRHIVDFFIPSLNKCIEIKSTWTFEKKQDNVFLKQEAGKKLGYEYEIWVYNAKGERVVTHY